MATGYIHDIMITIEPLDEGKKNHPTGRFVALGTDHAVERRVIDDVRGQIEYGVSGAGATLVLVPGSCSTGAAWRAVTAEWHNRFRFVTTSLLGYGQTTERRTSCDTSITREAEILESVIRKAGDHVHLIGHSFGGLVALAVALRRQVSVVSLVLIEVPAVELLKATREEGHYCAFRCMTERYLADFKNGNKQAIAAMIDFYGGSGTFASWPPRVRAYAIETTPVNMLDWATAYGFTLSPALLARITMPTLVLWGSASHPAMRRVNALLSDCIPEAVSKTIDDAAHFMIATHAKEVSRLIAEHVHSAEVHCRQLEPII